MWHFLFKLIAIVVIDLLYCLLQIRRKYTKIPFLSISKHSITIKTHIVRTYKEKNNIIFQIVSTLQVSVFIWSAFLGVSLSLSLAIDHTLFNFDSVYWSPSCAHAISKLSGMCTLYNCAHARIHSLTNAYSPHSHSILHLILCDRFVSLLFVCSHWNFGDFG